MGSLKGYLSGISLLVLPISLPHGQSSLLGVATCVGLILSNDPIQTQNVLSVLVCICSISKCAGFITQTLNFNDLFSYKSHNL